MPEQGEGNEHLREEALIEHLRVHGINDLEKNQPLSDWLAQKEEAVIEAGRSPEGEISIMRDQAELYVKAGLLEEAKEILEQAMDYAFHINSALYEEIRVRAGELK